MRTSLLRTYGVSIAALGLALSLVVTPVMAEGGMRNGGGGGHGAGMGGHGGGLHSSGGMVGHGGMHSGGRMVGHGGGMRNGGGMATRGSRYGGGGYGNGYQYGGAALGLGLLGGAIIGSQYPYYDSNYGYGAGYDYDRQNTDGSYCANRFRSYDPASGTYLGYDGLRHPCP